MHPDKRVIICMATPVFCSTVIAVLLATASAKVAVDKDTYHWVSDYGTWRRHDTVSLQQWEDNTPLPIRPALSRAHLQNMTDEEGTAAFKSCIRGQAKAFTNHVLKYRSPRLQDVAKAVRRELQARYQTVSPSSLLWWQETRPQCDRQSV